MHPHTDSWTGERWGRYKKSRKKEVGRKKGVEIRRRVRSQRYVSSVEGFVARFRIFNQKRESDLLCDFFNIAGNEHAV
jgi:hypothetical protein